MNKNVVIIDYKLGNLFSVNQAFVNIGIDAKITSSPSDVEEASAIVLPGVGAFGEAMNNLNSLDLIGSLERAVRDGKPLLGICLGLQLLFDESEEFGSPKGLGMLKGNVQKFHSPDPLKSIRVPQIAWNSVHRGPSHAWEKTPLEDLKDGEDMYFVHSYYIKPHDPAVILAETTYEGIKYASSVIKDNIFACQFHPEKSANKGLKIYQKWASQNGLI